jgi:hypothetical protein
MQASITQKARSAIQSLLPPIVLPKAKKPIKQTPKKNPATVGTTLKKSDHPDDIKCLLIDRSTLPPGDRLVHNPYKINLKGESLRKKAGQFDDY